VRVQRILDEGNELNDLNNLNGVNEVIEVNEGDIQSALTLSVQHILVVVQAHMRLEYM